MKMVTALFCSLLCVLASAEPPKRIGATELANSDRYLMDSTKVGDHFRIDVLLPIGYHQSDQTYPVVYVTDANYLLPSAAATYLAQATAEYPKMIIVGIGWDVPSITRIRVRDFTPTCNAEFRAERSMTKSDCGQADRFSQFIGTELQPFIDQTYRASGDNTLVGYSYGGLYALYALFAHTDLFDRYLIGSPSIGWDNEYLFRLEKTYAKSHKDLAKAVYLSAGGKEGGGTVPSAYRMREQLLDRRYPNLELKFEVLGGETHMTSISPAVMRGLGYLLGAKNPPE